MKALGKKLSNTVCFATKVCLLWGLCLTRAIADIAVEPAAITPDANGVIRFSVLVSGVPAPGFRSYALSMSFEGAAVNLVDSIDSFTTPPPADAVSCAVQLRLDAVSETVLPGIGVILESGQGAFVLDSVGGGSLLASDNQVVDATTAQYNVGVAGETSVVTPQTGSGSLIDFLCYVGAAVSNGTTVTVTPGLYPGLNGAIFLDQPGSLPIDSTFIAGVIQVVGSAADGDLNVDGVVNVVDVLLGQRILTGQLPLTQDYLDHGDVAPLSGGVPASDGLFNLGDLLVIERKALHIINF